MLAFVSAESLTYHYKLNSLLEIKNPCYFNGTYCPAATICKLTVYDPENLVILNNQEMTYSVSYFNYTLPNGNYSLGSYKCDMMCTYSGISGSQSFYLEIETGGNIYLFIILSIFSVIILVLGFTMKNQTIGFISGTAFILTGLYSFIFGIGNLANLYTDGIAIISLGMGLFFMISAAYDSISESGLFSSGGEYLDSLDSDDWGKP
jgi:hypothetical protein